MTQNMTDNFFYDEMLSHPALFLHRKPQNILIINGSIGIIAEVLKHPNIQRVHVINSTMDIDDPRISYQSEKWLNQCDPGSIDIIIIGEAITMNYPLYSQLLNDDGILVQPSPSSIYDVTVVKNQLQEIEQSGFKKLQFLNFHQPSHQGGWRTLILVSKHAKLKRIREKDIYNRSFATRFYNLDTHKAAMALPEFLREELEPV